MNPVGSSPSPSARAWLMPAFVVALALAAGHALRFVLVEPADVAQLCDAAPGSSLACVLRGLTVWSFARQGLGWTALGLAVLACWMALKGHASRGHSALKLAAMALGSLGLVLYNADPSAWALTLAIMSHAGQNHPTKQPTPGPSKHP
jgi:hypothetical protein